jgi:hypothetical protein
LSNWYGGKTFPAYAYVTLTGTEPIKVKPGESIKFNQNGAIRNIKFNDPSDTITILKSGDYRIEYTILLGGPASTSVYGLFLNNSLVGGELTNYGIQRQVDGANLMLVGQAIIHISKRSKLRLTNIGPSTDTLLPVLGGIGINAASLSIVKLS